MTEAKAEWFASRFSSANAGDKVFMAQVNKADALACLDERKEQEIIVAPEYVTLVE